MMDYLVCSTCGTQYGDTSRSTCRVCIDPRQYVPPSGHSFTTLRTLRDSKKYRNEIRMDPYNSSMYSIWTVPQFAIGQRAILVRTPNGNVLWDCVSYLDEETIDAVNKLGGISMIVISHPHFYSSHLEWANVFNCKVCISTEDSEWLCKMDKEKHILIKEKKVDLLGDGELLLVKLGGHFPGSNVLYWKSAKKLLTGDTIMVVPSGMSEPLPGTTSFTFMWSYPNSIPLPPKDIHNIWKGVSELEIDDVHAAWWGRDVRGKGKERILYSAQLIVNSMGYTDHAIHREVVY